MVRKARRGHEQKHVVLQHLINETARWSTECSGGGNNRYDLVFAERARGVLAALRRLELPERTRASLDWAPLD